MVSVSCMGCSVGYMDKSVDAFGQLDREARESRQVLPVTQRQGAAQYQRGMRWGWIWV